jgi:hypothetical protein
VALTDKINKKKERIAVCSRVISSRLKWNGIRM